MAKYDDQSVLNIDPWSRHRNSKRSTQYRAKRPWVAGISSGAIDDYFVPVFITNYITFGYRPLAPTFASGNGGVLVHWWRRSIYPFTLEQILATCITALIAALAIGWPELLNLHCR